MTLFSSKQLRKATGNYSQKHIIDQGTHGVVYKGVLRDKRVVTIKKTRIHYRAEEWFIDELLTLTKVIHPNVVRLLGCCLEEEDPLLVYEFISNNTLFYHIHHTAGGMSWLTWENRLRVAIDSATALAYLHSEPVLGPIIHRDVKSTHILLDENYTAKVSNFGVSRLLPLGREPYTTVLDGYLDYASGGRLTERSDVYSFGVVLAELITGKKPEGVDVGRNLASYFVNAVEENQLFEILEPRILAEGTPEQLQAIGYLVYWCLNSKGCLRPTMKVVARRLKKLRDFTTHSFIQKRHETTVVQEAEQSDHS